MEMLIGEQRPVVAARASAQPVRDEHVQPLTLVEGEFVGRRRSAPGEDCVDIAIELGRPRQDAPFVGRDRLADIGKGAIDAEAVAGRRQRAKHSRIPA